MLANPLDAASIAARLILEHALNSAAAPQKQPDQHPDVVQISKAIGDPLRAAVLQVLAGDAFGVLELGEIFSMAQPAMSHHLKKLAEAGLVNKRREGTSVYYQRSPAFQDPLLAALFNALDQRDCVPAHANAIEGIHLARAQRSQHFFSNHADALAAQTALICAPRVYRDAVLDMALKVDRRPKSQALEVGPGSGEMLSALAPHFTKVTGIDNAQEMLKQARELTAHLDNVELVEADFANLSRNTHIDLLVAAMVLHHMPSPAKFFQQAAHLVGSQGLLVVAELCTHSQDWVRESCGDVWLGFAPDEINHWANLAGLTRGQTQYLAQNNGFRVQVSTFAHTLNP